MTVKRLPILAAALSLLAACDVAAPPPEARAVRSLLEARRDNVVIQKWDISCGAAALATLLTYQEGVKVTEKEVAGAMLAHTNIDQVRAQLGFSLLDLKKYAQNRGLDADGYGDVSLRDLTEFGPSIVPVILRGFNHFVVFRGIEGDRVLLADPAWGDRTMQIPYFLSIWQSRVAFAVNRKDNVRPAGRLVASAKDFWASSPTYEPTSAKIEIAKLLAPEPAKAQTEMVAANTAALTQTAAGAPTTSTAATPRPADTEPEAEPVKRAPVQVEHLTAAAKPVPANPPAIKLAAAGQPLAAEAQVEAPVAVAAASAKPAMSEALVKAMLNRGDSLFAIGDVSAARLLYERAAESGSAQAAADVAKTYDPIALAAIHATGMQPDLAAAAAWYKKGRRARWSEFLSEFAVPNADRVVQPDLGQQWTGMRFLTAGYSNLMRNSFRAGGADKPRS